MLRALFTAQKSMHTIAPISTPLPQLFFHGKPSLHDRLEDSVSKAIKSIKTPVENRQEDDIKHINRYLEAEEWILFCLHHQLSQEKEPPQPLYEIMHLLSRWASADIENHHEEQIPLPIKLTLFEQIKPLTPNNNHALSSILILGKLAGGTHLKEGLPNGNHIENLHNWADPVHEKTLMRDFRKRRADSECKAMLDHLVTYYDQSLNPSVTRA
ncbi:MAG: hypothetical protein CL521_03530 [Actinobacteria bacterium]|nr:hypothetical protein [Actinomycetota bacterium]